VCVVVLFVWLAPGGAPEAGRAPAVAAPSESEVDERLQRAAERSLGGRSGTILVMDARTGRLRAAVGARLAYDEAFAPGSIVKPFTLLALLRASAVGESSRAACAGRYEREGFSISCAHPRFKSPFGTAEALAHSCNVFFARAGEALDSARFVSTLEEFGFGSATGAGGEREQSGAVPRGVVGTPEMLGESGRLQVTPAQALAAYAALFNGGRLFVPRRAPAGDFEAHESARVTVAEGHRRLLAAGMRGAITEGTAARAGLAENPLRVFGKTGTSTPRAGFRPQGWFVGLAPDGETDAGEADEGRAGEADAGVAPPEKIGLAVLVFLRRGRGSEAAAVSRPVFDEYARALASRRFAPSDAGEKAAKTSAVTNESGSEDAGGAEASSAGGVSVRVRLARARATLTLDLEDYVFGVLAAEGSVEDEPEALKALAVAARSYALKNLGRHKEFDLCDTTHCQRFAPVADETARPDFYESARRAVAETAGEVLRDSSGRFAESYFSASCGGASADIAELWGVAKPPAHLRGGRDEACAGGAQDGRGAWTDVIAAEELLRALRADARSDVGARLDAVRVARRDSTGRAALVALEGERRRTLRGWDFKIIVGRSLGWNVLKSSRFEVARAGDKFVFRGSGFGHGLGLCQAGAHRLAARGAAYRHILRRYMPGTSVGDARTSDTPRRASVTAVAHRAVLLGADTANAERGTRSDGCGMMDAECGGMNDEYNGRGSSHSSLITHHSSLITSPPLLSGSERRRTLAGERVRLSYPARAPSGEAEGLLRAVEAARAEVSRRAARAGLDASGVVVEVVLHETTGDFTAATGEPAWAAAVTRGRRVDLQPLAALRRRGVLQTTLRHEMVHAFCEALGRGRAPRWLVEGLAAHVAGEGPLLARFVPKKRMSAQEIERGLRSAATAEEARAFYAAAHAEAAALVRREGEAAVWLRAVRG
jgi:stage II sporulation protein D